MAQSGPQLQNSAVDFEVQRELRIAQNNARLEALGISIASNVIAQTAKASRAKVDKLKQLQAVIEPSRKSRRLSGSKPEFHLLVDDALLDDEGGLIPLLEFGVDHSPAARHERMEKLRTSTAQSRSTVYDKEIGITCHFCRQKTLCKEPDCPRCSRRDASETCIGKSECSKCGSATGQFCRSCLRLRYGWELEDVRSEMEKGAFLCPHCYEEEHPEEGWICNSSICMTRRGFKPTGIAIHKARELGFLSVAHLVQSQLNKHKKAQQP